MNELDFRTEISELLCGVSSGCQGERANPHTQKKEEDRNQTQRRDHSEKTALGTVILHPSHFSRKRCPKSLSAEETFSPFVFLCTGSPPAVINKTFPAQPSHLLFLEGVGWLVILSLTFPPCLQMAELFLYLLSIISFCLSLHCLPPLAYQSVSALHRQGFFQAL